MYVCVYAYVADWGSGSMLNTHKTRAMHKVQETSVQFWTPLLHRHGVLCVLRFIRYIFVALPCFVLYILMLCVRAKNTRKESAAVAAAGAVSTAALIYRFICQCIGTSMLMRISFYMYVSLTRLFVLHYSEIEWSKNWIFVQPPVNGSSSILAHILYWYVYDECVYENSTLTYLANNAQMLCIVNIACVRQCRAAVAIAILPAACYPDVIIRIVVYVSHGNLMPSPFECVCADPLSVCLCLCVCESWSVVSVYARSSLRVNFLVVSAEWFGFLHKTVCIFQS